ncbi:MAG: DUF1284 domain-containing protein [Archaeoglobaceae archaeon]
MHRLRGHHLICLHFFKGEGYDEEFKKRLREILKNISVVEIVEGVDEICEFCPHNLGYCNYHPEAEKEVKELDNLALRLIKLEIGSKIGWSELKSKIPSVLEDWKNFACRNCEWRVVCNV